MPFVQPMFWATPQAYRPQHIGLSLFTAPTVEPLTVAEVRRHLLIDSSAGEPAPTAPTVALPAVAVAGNVDNGAHRVGFTFITADGESEIGPLSAVVTIADKTVNGKIYVTAIAIGGAAVTSRKAYLVPVAGGAPKFAATLADNTSTTMTLNVADSALGAEAPEVNTTSDPELSGLITAARMYCEAETDMGFLPQTWRETFTRWPGLPVTLSKAPLQTSPTAPIVTYIDSAGDPQTLATTEYTVDAPAGPYPERGRLLPVYAPDVTPVTAYGMSNAATVQYVVGFATAAAVPMPVKQAMKLLISFWFANRGDTDSGAWVETQKAVSVLLQPLCREVLV